MTRAPEQFNNSNETSLTPAEFEFFNSLKIIPDQTIVNIGRDQEVKLGLMTNLVNKGYFKRLKSLEHPSSPIFSFLILKRPKSVL